MVIDTMKFIRNILIIAVALVIQSTVFGKLDLFGVRPDLALVVLIFLAGESSTVELIFYGFLIGFIQDVYTPEYLGYNAFAMSITAFVLDMIKERLTVENYTVRLFTTFMACLLHDLVYLSLLTKLEMAVFVSVFVTESLPGAVYTSVVALAIVKVWQWTQSGGLFYVVRELLGSGR